MPRSDQLSVITQDIINYSFINNQPDAAAYTKYGLYGYGKPHDSFEGSLDIGIPDLLMVLHTSKSLNKIHAYIPGNTFQSIMEHNTNLPDDMFSTEHSWNFNVKEVFSRFGRLQIAQFLKRLPFLGVTEDEIVTAAGSHPRGHLLRDPADRSKWSYDHDPLAMVALYTRVLEPEQVIERTGYNLGHGIMIISGGILALRSELEPIEVLGVMGRKEPRIPLHAFQLAAEQF